MPRTGIIHRLDKNTSGLLVITRNMTSHYNLANQLQKNRFKKIYHTLISGNIQKPFSIEEPIGRHPINRKKMIVTDRGKHALSIIRPLDKYQKIGRAHV